MDTPRAKNVFARVFAIRKQRRERRSSRHVTPRLIFASPAGLPTARSRDGGDALHNAYWLWHRRRALSGPRCAVSLAALAVLFRMHSEAA